MEELLKQVKPDSGLSVSDMLSMYIMSVGWSDTGETASNHARWR